MLSAVQIAPKILDEIGHLLQMDFLFIIVLKKMTVNNINNNYYYYYDNYYDY